MAYRTYTLTATIVAPHHFGDADHALRTMLAALPDGEVLNAGVEFDDEGDRGFGTGLRLDLVPRQGALLPPVEQRLSPERTGTTAWTPAEKQVPTGADALFSLPSLAYRSEDGRVRYREAYTGRVIGRWHDAYEFTATSGVVEAIARRLNDLPGQNTEITFEGDLLVVQLPPSLGCGVHETQAIGGRWVVGWALPWHPVTPHDADTITT
ncbi:hypothetical protein ACLQ24_00230 [Micromonospora sp. DT4]|uniref:hypothetical protein n=1 Tax=Micromonospora sp. DT4 TaxID=3393438 RepID=UPI003CECB516